MGIRFSNTDTLTESQRWEAKSLGITEAEMIRRMKVLQNQATHIISVIIPVYNGEKYIKQAIESVQKQTFTNYEIIVVDDGSTDSTLDIITQIEGITVLIKPNGGTASALNCGIRNAKGDWIKWLSADDVMYPNCLQLLMNNIQEKDRIYYTNYDIIDQNNNSIGVFVEPKRDESELWGFFFGNGSSSLIHKSVFEKCGVFDESLGHSEDYEFWLRATQVYGVKMQLIPEMTIRYRRHPDQLTNKVGGSLDSLIKNKIKRLCETPVSERQPEIKHT